MSFFDQYVDTSGGTWIKAPVRQAIIDNGIALDALSVVFDPHNIDPTSGSTKPRYVVTFRYPEPATGDTTEGKWSFATGVESRDRMLAAMAEYLATEGAVPPRVKVTKVGRSQILVAA